MFVCVTHSDCTIHYNPLFPLLGYPQLPSWWTECGKSGRLFTLLVHKTPQAIKDSGDNQMGCSRMHHTESKIHHQIWCLVIW